jgi:uracil-DNA glycosylase
MHCFPFGMPVRPVEQQDRSPKRVFVLGVYASAVHARWLGHDGRTWVNALAVASEPEIFWRGDDAHTIIAAIQIPPAAGKLIPASPSLNGPSGRTLDDKFLAPLGLERHDAWLCDLLPESRKNPGQAAALTRAYDPVQNELGLPAYDWPPVPEVLANSQRCAEIEQELCAAAPDVLITLGDQPLRWFVSKFGSRDRLSDYGDGEETYGRLHPLCIAGRNLNLLPLVHPRQAGGLGSHSQRWSALHQYWIDNRAAGLLNRD